jgi:hypothetical protein
MVSVSLLAVVLAIGMTKLWANYKTLWIFPLALCVTLLDASMEAWLEPGNLPLFERVLWSAAWVAISVLGFFVMCWLIEYFYPVRKKYREYKEANPNKKFLF